MNYHEEEILGKAYDNKLMKRLLNFLKPYKMFVTFSVILLLMFAAGELIGPYLIKIAIDDKIANKDMNGLAIVSIIYLGILFLQAIVVYYQSYLTQWIGQNVMLDIRMKIFSHIQKLPLSFFDKNPVGRMVTRTTNDVETLNEMLSSGIVAIFGDIFVLLGIIIVMLKINWQLALVTFSVLPLIIYASSIFRIKVREAYRKVRVRIARINTFLQENISGMSTVQIFNREKKNLEHFDILNKKHLDAHLQTIGYYAVFFPAIELISSIALALIIWKGGKQVFASSVTLGVVVAFIQYAERFFHPIRDLSDKYNIMQAAMASSERIFKLLDAPEQNDDPVELNTIPVSKGSIEFKNVTFSYNPDEPVLKNISFSIKPGEKIAVVGATGSGKTTLINLITRMYEPQSGQILLDNVDISTLKLKDLRKRISMVLQDVFIFSGTIRDNIKLGNNKITDDQMINAAKNVNAHSFIEKLANKYDFMLMERGGNISVGQKQLVSFARALAFNPDILILDEATSSVDTETELLIRDAISKLMAQRTSLIIAHRLSTIQNVDRILVIHKGELREMGTHNDLLKKRGIYYRLYQLQFADDLNRT